MRWSNVPVPEPHVAAIVGAAGLHWMLPLRIPLARRTRLALAGPMMATGIGLVGWAVAAARDADVESDSALVTSGAYALTRNPMYVGVLLILLGEAIFFNVESLWSYTIFIVIIFTIFIVFVEEPRLRRDFGEEYTEYCKKVRRWI